MFFTPDCQEDALLWVVKNSASSADLLIISRSFSSLVKKFVRSCRRSSQANCTIEHCELLSLEAIGPWPGIIACSDLSLPSLDACIASHYACTRLCTELPRLVHHLINTALCARAPLPTCSTSLRDTGGCVQ
jgi:hypothetical protein